MKIISGFATFLFLLCAAQVDGTDIYAEGPEGGHVSFRCSHKLAYDNNKYFCKAPCTSSEDNLAMVEPGGTVVSRRITLTDTRDGAFNITISHLERSDAGTYWCKVGRWIGHTYTKVNLKVIEGLSYETTTNIEATTTMSIETARALTSGSNSVTNSTEATPEAHTQSYSSHDSKGEQPRTTASIVLYSVVGVLLLFIALVVVLMSFRKCKTMSRPQVKVGSKTKNFISVDQQQANRHNTNAGNTKHESTAVSSPVDQHLSSHIYENVRYVKNATETKKSAMTHIERSRTYIQTLPALPGQDTATAGRRSNPTEDSYTSRFRSKEPTALWFGLIFPQTDSH